ncbi:transposase [Rickettsia endosymbiont of Cantharis rufa]|uniref:transposase n=1 Tax=Rickettsia endosymbiont of Cantharis rufa TaxID=3066248 RepID=UPI0031333FD5
MLDIEPQIYPAEFKESAIRLAIESKQPFAQTARELGMAILPLLIAVEVES